MSVTATVSLAIVWISMLQGCGGGEDTAAAQPQPPAVDPRFASAEALLQHYNSLTTTAPINVSAALDLFYAENDLQRRMIDVTRRMLAIAELDRAMFDAFGEGWSPSARKPMFSPDQPASMRQRDDQRAQAELINSDGKAETLYLVRIGERWWVSGFTMEYDAEAPKDSRAIEAMERLASMLSPHIAPVTARVRRGEISSAREARQAVMLPAMQQHPDLMSVLQQVGEATK